MAGHKELHCDDLHGKYGKYELGWESSNLMVYNSAATVLRLEGVSASIFEDNVQN